MGPRMHHDKLIGGYGRLAEAEQHFRRETILPFLNGGRENACPSCAEDFRANRRF